MNNRSNMIAGWVLFACVIALGLSIATGMFFKGKRPATMGFVVEGVEEEGGPAAAAEQPIAVYLATATVAQGEAVFKKCAACHTATQGGPNGIGPNMWDNVGKPLGHVAGFPYSSALKEKGGTWTFDALNEWLKSPKAYVPGTKMSFAGLSKPEERAAVIVYMNSLGSNVPFPAAPAPAAAEPAAADAAAPAAGADAAAATPEATDAAAPAAAGAVQQ